MLIPVAIFAGCVQHDGVANFIFASPGIPMWYSQRHFPHLIGAPIIGPKSALKGTCGVYGNSDTNFRPPPSHASQLSTPYLRRGMGHVSMFFFVSILIGW